MKKLLVGCVLLAMLSGCAAQGFIPLSETTVTESGQVVETVAGYTRDASVAKEKMVFDAHNARTAALVSTHKNSGLKISFELVDLAPGVAAYLPKMVSVREPVKFDQHLPTEPSRHPVWTTVDNAVNVVAKTSLGIFAIDRMADTINNGWQNSAPTYNGPYQSYNQTAEPYFAPVEPAVLP